VWWYSSSLSGSSRGGGHLYQGFVPHGNPHIKAVQGRRARDGFERQQRPESGRKEEALAGGVTMSSLGTV